MKEACGNWYYSLLIKMTDTRNNKEEIKKQKKKKEAKETNLKHFKKSVSSLMYLEIQLVLLT